MSGIVQVLRVPCHRAIAPDSTDTIDQAALDRAQHGSSAALARLGCSGALIIDQ
jgi:hypothetical protein